MDFPSRRRTENEAIIEGQAASATTAGAHDTNLSGTEIAVDPNKGQQLAIRRKGGSTILVTVGRFAQLAGFERLHGKRGDGEAARKTGADERT